MYNNRFAIFFPAWYNNKIKQCVYYKRGEQRNMATKKRKTTTQRAASRKKRAEQRLPAGLGTLFAGLLLVVLAFVEGDSAWKALHDVLFGLFGCGSFVLGAAVCCLAVQYTRGEDLLPKIF